VTADEVNAVRLATLMRTALDASGWDYARAAALALGAAAHLAVAAGLRRAVIHEALDEVYASARARARTEEPS
jgi:hypothetical protein